MPDLAELRLDLAELQELQSQAKRLRVKDILSLEVRKLQSQISLQEEQVNQSKSSTGEKDSKPVTQPTNTRYTREITNYAWDQSEKFMKIYATELPGVQGVPKENVTSEFTEKSFKLRISDLDGKDYSLHVSKLSEEIIPSDCYHKVKTDMVLVMLKKSVAKTWAYVTEREKKAKEKKTPSMSDSKDPNDSMMDLLKQMYDDGDDEMKRTIAKSMYESRNKNPMDNL